MEIPNQKGGFYFRVSLELSNSTDYSFIPLGDTFVVTGDSFWDSYYSSPGALKMAPIPEYTEQFLNTAWLGQLHLLIASMH